MNNKKDVFKNAPDWAKYYAVDADGSAFWYEHKPAIGERCFITIGNVLLCTLNADNWQNSLIERVAEPATLYDWNTAPDWANWAAMDKCGHTYWYEQKPAMSNWANWWFAMDGNMSINERKTRLPYNWENTLEQRPQRKETKSESSVDYKAEIQFLQNAVKELENVITEKNKVIEQLKTALTKLIKKANKLKQLT